MRFTLGHSYQNRRGDHFDMRKGARVVGRYVGVGKKETVKKFTEYRGSSLKANESLS